MFRSLKLYINQVINLEQVLNTLLDFGYKRQDMVSEEGEFARRGGILDIYPATFECPVRIELKNDTIYSIYNFNIITGRHIWKHKLVIVLPCKHFRPVKRIWQAEELPIYNFLDLNKGDYVVHVKHGIGKFLGGKKINKESSSENFLVIEYDKKEKLYVPIEDTHLVQKYIGFRKGRRVKLSRLGTNEWRRIKERTRKNVVRIAQELLQIQAVRKASSGFAFSCDCQWQEIFEKRFPYRETEGQAKATYEVKKDMEAHQPMDRLICGDVGYGKTEVAMRAAFKAVMDHKQVAILVPTTILAQQHYYNFLKRIEDFPVNIQMLSRFKTASEQKKIVEHLADGKVDIVIGTHRLLSSDVRFYDLGLVIIDEEQRFGVKSKEALKKLRLTVDVLTLTATPIPRTLYMGLMNAKDISIINTPPENRIPVATFVAEYDEDLIRQAINKEVSRNGQVYFIHNRIQDIKKISDKINQICGKAANIEFAHGRMHSLRLEKIMLSFLEKKIDVLISTSIIESGIDIPSANTLIVNNAENFGLADLHQLRGRVGRFNRRAYAYFLTSKAPLLTDEAKKRLKAIDEYSNLGAGFSIAMEDLEIRGAGNLLGIEQHGYIQAVGFDLYCRLLRDAVNAIKQLHQTYAAS